MLPTWEVTYPPVPSLLGVPPHGVLTAAGIVLGYVLLARAVHARNLPPGVLDKAVLWAVLAGVIGARIDYVVSHLDQFDSVGRALRLWEGGLALFGGLIGAVLAAAVVLRRAGVHLPRMLDAAAPMVALGIAVGRLGDLLITDHLGTPTTSGWALAYLVRSGYELAPGFGPSPARPPSPGESCADAGQYFAGCTYHLTPGYDLLGALALAALLFAMRRRAATARAPPWPYSACGMGCSGCCWTTPEVWTSVPCWA